VEVVGVNDGLRDGEGGTVVGVRTEDQRGGRLLF